MLNFAIYKNYFLSLTIIEKSFRILYIVILIVWRVVRVVEGAALEMLCPQKGPRVRIPNSPPNFSLAKYHVTIKRNQTLFGVADSFL